MERFLKTIAWLLFWATSSDERNNNVQTLTIGGEDTSSSTPNITLQVTSRERDLASTIGQTSFLKRLGTMNNPQVQGRRKVSFPQLFGIELLPSRT